jgi:UDP-2-acetamido-3-amino-2,3-dideoxy-glucuronate N-acetyltransferase
MSGGAKLLALPTFPAETGVLGVAQAGDTVPFGIARAFYITNLSKGAVRGGHAHKACEQFLICLAGALQVRADDGNESRTFELSDTGQGLYLPAMTWVDFTATSDGSVCLVLASHAYDEDDYVRERSAFNALSGGGGE